MNQRFLLSLIAACLLTTWMVPEASALSRRLPRSVENFHTCTDAEDPCYGATGVTDTLYGWDGEKAICTMTGRVFCIPVDNLDICSDSDSKAPIVSADSWTAGATFQVGSAENLTFLNPSDGQDVCDATYFDTELPMETVFNKFWPNELVAHSVYTGEFTNLLSNTTTYELIEYCYINIEEEKYDCVTLWDSSPKFASASRPKLPCCGEENKLKVQIVGGGGTVKSKDGEINCPDSACFAVYDGRSAPYDGCPEVVLKATPWEVDGSGYAFTGWDGCDSAVGDTCTTSARGNPTVTATFKESYHTLTVTINYGGGKGKAYIWSPRSNFDDPLNQYYCDDKCYKKFGDTHEFPIGQFVVIKRQGAPFSNWDGVCKGTPNSSDTCSFYMTESKEVVVNFVP